MFDYTLLQGARTLGIITVETENVLLHVKSREVTVEEMQHTSFTSFLQSLTRTASEAFTPEGYKCVGLSAIQVGVPLRVFVMMDLKSERFFTYINPVIVPLGEEREVKSETCLSLPTVKSPKERHLHIKLTYLDTEGREQMVELHKFQARIAQHEQDHLDGILMTD